MSDEWVETTLGEIALINPDKTPKWDADYRIQYVDIASVSRESGIDLSSVGEYAFGVAPGRARRLIRGGDVLVSTVRPNLRAFALVPESLDGGVASTGFAVLRGTDVALSGYLWAITQTDAFVDAMVSRCTGTNYPAIRAADIAGYEVSLPPLPVQRRIVDLLAHFDAHIANLRTEIECFRKLEAATLASWFSEETLAMGTSCLSDSASVYDCLHKTAPPASVADDVFGYSVGTRDIKDGLIHTAEAKPVTESVWNQWSKKVRVSPGDIIMAREAPVGPVALVPEGSPPLCLGQRTVLIRANAGLDPVYLSGLLRSPATQSWMLGESAGQTVAHLNVADIKRIPMPSIPQIDRQRAIGEVVSDLLDGRVKMEQEWSALGVLRSAVLNELLSGGLTVESAYDGFVEVA